MKVKEESEKAGLNLSIQKKKIMASGPITSWEIGKQWKQCQTLFLGAPKSLQTVTAAVKLKDACSLEQKLSILRPSDLRWLKSLNFTYLFILFLCLVSL